MRRLLVLAGGILALGGGESSAGAATIEVTIADDLRAADGRCSLREAIDVANADAAEFPNAGECPAGEGADTIVLSAGTFKLAITGAKEGDNATGDLDVLSTATIAGAGAASTTIDADGKDRALDVIDGVTLTIRNVTVTGGHAPDGGPGAVERQRGNFADNAAVYDRLAVRLDDVVVVAVQDAFKTAYLIAGASRCSAAALLVTAWRRPAVWLATTAAVSRRRRLHRRARPQGARPRRPRRPLSASVHCLTRAASRARSRTRR